MFKVICIDASVGKNFGIIPKFKEGDILDALPSFTGDEDYYRIVQHDYEEGAGYIEWWSRRFIPLSSIDETEILKNRELDAIINLFSYDHSI